MKRLATIASFLVALGLCSVALAASTLSGTYKAKIHTTALHGQVNGTWTITFKSGAYKVTDNGAAVIHGKYTTKGDTVTLRDKSGRDACPAPGTYRFKLTKNTLKFTKVSDSNPKCIGRVTVLRGKFKKVD